MSSSISLLCKPGSSNPGLSVHEGVLTVRVRERAIEGAANEACVRALSEALGIPPSSVQLVAGARSRLKRFRLNGIADEEARIRLGL